MKSALDYKRLLASSFFRWQGDTLCYSRLAALSSRSGERRSRRSGLGLSCLAPSPCPRFRKRRLVRCASFYSHMATVARIAPLGAKLCELSLSFFDRAIRLDAPPQKAWATAKASALSTHWTAAVVADYPSFLDSLSRA
jgi:hypothetical protein